MAVDELDKAQADTAPLTGDFEKMGTQKVQLDIDDAPFLNDPDDEPPPPPPAPVQDKAPAVQQEEEAPKKSKKKLFIVGGAALVLLLGVAAVLYFFVLGPKEPVLEPEVIVVPAPPPPPPPRYAYDIPLNRFVVELNDQEGNKRFLEAAFVLTTQNPMAFTEAEDKVIVLRDSIYYYLRTQSYEFLHDPANNEQLRKELLKAVNEYLLQGKMEDVLFDTYLIR